MDADAPVRLRLARVGALVADATMAPDWLSPEERARLVQLAAPRRRAAFLAGRLLARQLLTESGGGRPHDWALAAGLHQPPRVLRGPGVSAFPQLSISHSGDWVACAAAAEPVGIDIEAAARRRDIVALAATVCSEGERAWLMARLPAEREAAFYRLWTLKEAWVKRRGEGGSPGRFRRIEAQPITAAPGEAHTWDLPGLTVALIGHPRPIRLESELPTVEPIRWRVVERPA